MPNSETAALVSEISAPKHLRFLFLGLGGAGGHVAIDVANLYTDTSNRHKFGGREFVDFVAVDTNQSSLIDFQRLLPIGNTLLMGNSTGGIGSGYSIERALKAFEESKQQIQELVAPYDAVMIAGSLGKSTGLGTIAPMAEMIREMGKLTIPLVISPSFDNGESDVSADRADNVLKDLLQREFKFLQLLNDAAYKKRTTLPEAYKTLNRPLAQGLVGLISLFTTPSDVDIADLAMQILSGAGRIRIASWELKLGDYSDDKSLGKLQAVTTANCANQMFQFDHKIGATLVLTRGDMDNFVLRSIRNGVRDFLKDTRYNDESPTLKAHYPASVENLQKAIVTVIFSEQSEREGTRTISKLKWQYLPDGQELVLTAPAAAEGSDSMRSEVAHSSSTHRENGTHEKVLNPAGSNETVKSFNHLSAMIRALKDNNPHAWEVVASEDPSRVKYLNLQQIREAYDLLKDRAVFEKFSEPWKERILAVLHPVTRFDEMVIGTSDKKVTVRRDASAEELREMIRKLNGRGFTSAQHQEILDRAAILTMYGPEVLESFPTPAHEAVGGASFLERLGGRSRKSAQLTNRINGQ